MDTTMHMTDAKKRNIGLLSILPFITFTIFALYFVWITQPLMAHDMLQEHGALSSVMSAHYGTLFALLAIAFITGASTLIYFMVHIARIRNMSASTKLAWMIFMFLLGGVAFPVFWYSEIRTEPEYLPIYPDIA